MICKECSYILSDFDDECPRCARLRAAREAGDRPADIGTPSKRSPSAGVRAALVGASALLLVAAAVLVTLRVTRGGERESRPAEQAVAAAPAQGVQPGPGAAGARAAGRQPAPPTRSAPPGNPAPAGGQPQSYSATPSAPAGVQPQTHLAAPPPPPAPTQQQPTHPEAAQAPQGTTEYGYWAQAPAPNGQVSAPVAMGSVRGTVTYYFNRNFGDKPDVGSKVFLFAAEGWQEPPLGREWTQVPADQRGDIGAYVVSLDRWSQWALRTTQVDGSGTFLIDRVPAGHYIVAIESSHTNGFMERDVLHQHAFIRVTVTEGGVADCSHDFGMTYL